MEEFLIAVKRASRTAAQLSGRTRTEMLNEMAKALRSKKDIILSANEQDIKNARSNALSSAMIDRLLLNDRRVDEMAEAIGEIAALRDPLGDVIDGWTNPDGLRIEKISVPIGVVCVIYESRPNVTADAAALCLKSGNAAILRGGKEAANSNKAIISALQEVLSLRAMPPEMIAEPPDSSREGIKEIIGQSQYVDLVVPRGGAGLIRFVSENSAVPVVKHDRGLCHLYIHKSADYAKAESIAINAKVQRPSACNAIETLLIDAEVAPHFLPRLKAAFDREKTKLRGCQSCRAIIDVAEATSDDWAMEYLDNILSIKVVSGIDEALDHIAAYGSMHSEAIIAESGGAIERFLSEVDAACVYANASTRFTDGGQFGFGAEVGISTNKLHARGPMGVKELTTYKYRVCGNGQIRD
ncbi:MAG: glutamate-5-semialdehyde dehydrogenase [Helicobacteraceae bacterium]|jgi:glutamate-5-semialdehyde dehydrogenase|nr:glutamate-5-semialdehyde dehydrogenase [Helicobacteraceae bacterium]